MRPAICDGDVITVEPAAPREPDSREASSSTGDSTASSRTGSSASAPTTPGRSSFCSAETRTRLRRSDFAVAGAGRSRGRAPREREAWPSGRAGHGWPRAAPPPADDLMANDESTSSMKPITWAFFDRIGSPDCSQAGQSRSSCACAPCRRTRMRQSFSRCSPARPSTTPTASRPSRSPRSTSPSRS